MLIEFKIQNYGSFCDPKVFSMVAGNYKGNPENINEDKILDVETLKSAVIYGANASGKSFFLKSFMFVICLLKETTKFPYEKFRLGESKQCPFSTYIAFKVNNKIYKYEMSFISNNIGENIIKEEKLTCIYKNDLQEEVDLFSKSSIKEIIIFHRKDSEFTSDVNLLKDEIVNALKMTLGTKEIFLNRLLWNEKISYNYFEDIKLWLEKIYCINIQPEEIKEGKICHYFLNSQDYQNFLKKIIVEFADLGIVDIKEEKFEGSIPKEIKNKIKEDLEKNNKGEVAILKKDSGGSFFRCILDKQTNDVEFYKFVFIHSGKDKEQSYSIDFDKESRGTQSLFLLSLVFYKLLYEDSIVIIDELEANLHSFITVQLIDMLHKKKNVGQLIFTTHDLFLLDSGLFRRDQVWFVDKNNEGMSDLRCAAEYREDKVRSDKRISKAYVQGRFGAIPIINQFYS